MIGAVEFYEPTLNIIINKTYFTRLTMEKLCNRQPERNLLLQMKK